MVKNLNLNNIDDLIYCEGATSENLSSQEISSIIKNYNLKIEENLKHSKDNKDLFIYDYRSPILDLNHRPVREHIDNPAIQPHDSHMNFFSLSDDVLKISGKGNSYMNYLEYDINMAFSGVKDLLIKRSDYLNFSKVDMVDVSENDFTKNISKLKFREVFLEKENAINFVFIDYRDEDQDNEKRSIVVLKFKYDGIELKCKPIENKKTNKKRF